MVDISHTKAEKFWDKARTVMSVGTAVGAITMAVLGKGEQDAGRHVLAGVEYVTAAAGLTATIAFYRAHVAFNREKLATKKEKWREREARAGDWLAPHIIKGIDNLLSVPSEDLSRNNVRSTDQRSSRLPGHMPAPAATSSGPRFPGIDRYFASLSNGAQPVAPLEQPAAQPAATRFPGVDRYFGTDPYAASPRR